MALPKAKRSPERNARPRIVLIFVLVGAAIGCLGFHGAELPQLTTTRQEAIPCQVVVEAEELMTDSTNATVMGFATGYSVRVYRSFVGSLRKSGFRGHIILAVAPDIEAEAVEYLLSRRVTISKVEFIPCTHGMFSNDDKEQAEHDEHEKEMRSCVAPYDKLKSRWGRFPFLRDRLKECETCTGPVLITDVRDTFFQRDPFGSGQPQVQGLQVFEEHVKLHTTHWLVEWPVRECKGIVFDKPMLCSGTTIGTREAMIDYLNIMEEEMNAWMADRKCHFKTNGDDQSIHNYLYYQGKLPFAKAIPNGLGIVNTVGVQASVIREAHRDRMEAKGKSETDAYEGTKLGEKPWITEEYDVTDKEGYILDHDGKKSAVVHQYDRFGIPLKVWLERASGLVDEP